MATEECKRAWCGTTLAVAVAVAAAAAVREEEVEKAPTRRTQRQSIDESISSAVSDEGGAVKAKEEDIIVNIRRRNRRVGRFN